MTATPRLEELGRELAAWLRTVVAGDPSFPNAGLVTDTSAVHVEPCWDGAGRLALIIRVPVSETGRVIGRGGMVSEGILGPLVRRVGARLGLSRVSIEVVAA
jgi:predicted RNA-binding protein YlqC (UPF0109 family)